MHVSGSSTNPGSEFLLYYQVCKAQNEILIRNTLCFFSVEMFNLRLLRTSGTYLVQILVALVGKYSTGL